MARLHSGARDDMEEGIGVVLSLRYPVYDYSSSVSSSFAKTTPKKRMSSRLPVPPFCLTSSFLPSFVRPRHSTLSPSPPFHLNTTQHHLIASKNTCFPSPSYPSIRLPYDCTVRLIGLDFADAGSAVASGVIIEKSGVCSQMLARG